VQDTCVYTLPDLYSEIEHLHIQEFSNEGILKLQIADLYQEDHTLLTPLWAGITTEEQVDKLIERKIEKETSYGRPYGLPAVPKPTSKAAEPTGSLIWLPWNAMVEEGLLSYHRITEAASLFSKNMAGIIQNLKQEKSFRTHYHASEATGSGQRNHLIGLPSPGLFLEILGIRPLSNTRIEILHKNPFAWPVKIRYRGTSILTTQEQVTINFPDGQEIVIDDFSACLVESSLTQLEKDS
jgi:hypothetical protein